jgi:predicted aldo/keto reductase-like oxidoreductase
MDRAKEEIFPYLRRKGVGIIVMGPTAGGRLCVPLEVFGDDFGANPAEIAFRFVFSNPNVDVVMSGPEVVSQLEKDVRIASSEERLSGRESQKLNEIYEKTKKLNELYCTGCGYCMSCPHGLNIPEIFKYYVRYKAYGMRKDAMDAYAYYGTPGCWIAGKKASECVECGACMDKCPQKIDIIKQLKEAHETLSAKPG